VSGGGFNACQWAESMYVRSPRSLSLPPLPTLHQALAAAEIAARRAVKQGLQGLQRLRGGGRGKKVVEEEEEEEEDESEDEEFKGQEDEEEDEEDEEDEEEEEVSPLPPFLFPFFLRKICPTFERSVQRFGGTSLVIIRVCA